MQDHEKRVKSGMEELRKQDEAFDSMVKEITYKIEEQIKERNAEKSFNPKSSTDYQIQIKVKAVPISKEQKQYLLEFLKYQYISRVAGEYFTLKKCLFSEQYNVRTHYYNY